MKPEQYIQQMLFLAGSAQVVLVLASFAIPKVLRWRSELSKVKPLVRQMFWTYAAYILGMNLAFGMLSILLRKELASQTYLAGCVTGFIAIYWISRILIQFFYFERSDFPKGKLNKLAEVLLVILFIFLSTVYSWAFLFNCKLI
jgi:hypothetical protein